MENSQGKEGKVDIQFMGKTYQVSRYTTLLGALLEIGWDSVKGVGCMGGCCGACGVLYRPPNESHVRTGLACRVPVQDGISFSLVGQFPLRKVHYDISKISDPKQALFDLFPEITTCRNCDLCVEACPQGINVQRSMWCAVFGDFREVAESFKSCVQCGLCARVCPVGICPFQVAVYVSRSLGARCTELPPGLLASMAKIKSGAYEGEWKGVLQEQVPPADQEVSK